MSTNVHISTKAQQIAEFAIQKLNEQLVGIDYLEAGATSEVFLVKSGTSEYVLKIANPNPGKTTSYSSDFAIRQALNEAGLPVAEPIATDFSEPSSVNRNWAIDRFCRGTHPERGSIPSKVSKQLGCLLRSLHDLPATGYGLLENTHRYFRGRCKDPVKGLQSRLESPWPFSEKQVNLHPSVLAEPALLRKLSDIEVELREFPMNGPNVIVHSDLHEAQMLIDGNNKLLALLDFNDAMVGRPEWDLGSYYYFHGRACLNDLLEGYTEDLCERSEYTNCALLAAILIALHHGNRGEILGKPHRIDASVKFLVNNLPKRY